MKQSVILIHGGRKDKSPFLISYPGWISEGKATRNNIKHISNMNLTKDETETKHSFLC